MRYFAADMPFVPDGTRTPEQFKASLYDSDAHIVRVCSELTDDVDIHRGPSLTVQAAHAPAPKKKKPKQSDKPPDAPCWVQTCPDCDLFDVRTKKSVVDLMMKTNDKAALFRLRESLALKLYNKHVARYGEVFRCAVGIATKGSMSKMIRACFPERSLEETYISGLMDRAAAALERSSKHCNLKPGEVYSRLVSKVAAKAVELVHEADTKIAYAANMDGATWPRRAVDEDPWSGIQAWVHLDNGAAGAQQADKVQVTVSNHRSSTKVSFNGGYVVVSERTSRFRRRWKKHKRVMPKRERSKISSKLAGK
jgi:hypothetical protein